MAKVRAAGIFLVRTDNSVLICHPTNHNPNFFSIPKGKVDEGESLVDAAIRETWEETNIDLSKCKNLRALEAVNYGHKKKILYPFLLLESENQDLNWNEFDLKCNSFVSADRGGFPEMDGYKWVSLDEAKGLLHETQVISIDAIITLLAVKA